MWGVFFKEGHVPLDLKPSPSLFFFPTFFLILDNSVPLQTKNFSMQHPGILTDLLVYSVVKLKVKAEPYSKGTKLGLHSQT